MHIDSNYHLQLGVLQPCKPISETLHVLKSVRCLGLMDYKDYILSPVKLRLMAGGTVHTSEYPWHRGWCRVRIQHQQDSLLCRVQESRLTVGWWRSTAELEVRARVLVKESWWTLGLGGRRDSCGAKGVLSTTSYFAFLGGLNSNFPVIQKGGGNWVILLAQCQEGIFDGFNDPVQKPMKISKISY